MSEMSKKIEELREERYQKILNNEFLPAHQCMKMYEQFLYAGMHKEADVVWAYLEKNGDDPEYVERSESSQKMHEHFKQRVKHERVVDEIREWKYVSASLCFSAIEFFEGENPAQNPEAANNAFAIKRYIEINHPVRFV